jgi:hypothetical protein
MKVATWMKPDVGTDLSWSIFLLLIVSTCTLDEIEVWLLDVVT